MCLKNVLRVLLLFCIGVFSCNAIAEQIPPALVGRAEVISPQHIRFAWSGTQLIFHFTGTRLEASFNDNGANSFVVDVDGTLSRLNLQRGNNHYVLTEHLPDKEHTVTLTRRTEGNLGITTYLGSWSDGKALDLASRPHTFMVMGDSLSTGYGIEGKPPCNFTPDSENQYATFPAIVARHFNADLHVIALSGRGVVQNSDGSITNTLWDIKDRLLPTETTPISANSYIPDTIFVNIGSNDFGTGVDMLLFEEHYTKLLHYLREHYPDARIYSMAGPFLRDEPLEKAETTLKKVIAVHNAAGDKRIYFIALPGLAEDEIGCDMHPNTVANERRAQTLIAILQKDTGWK